VRLKTNALLAAAFASKLAPTEVGGGHPLCELSLNTLRSVQQVKKKSAKRAQVKIFLAR